MKHIISSIIVVLALVLIIGSVGAYELGNIGFGRCVLQCAVGAIVEWLILKNM